MDKNDLESLGITNVSKIIYNPSYDLLFEHETNPKNEGLERGAVSNLGAVAVDTGRFTGRSPQDKYFVKEDSSENSLWWAGPQAPGSGNQPIDQTAWDHLKGIAANQLSGKTLYVVDGFAGANPDTRLSVRTITEVAWQAHFCKNMFIRPSDEETQNFKPDWTIVCASKATCDDYREYGLNSEVFIAFHLKERMQVIGGTWYGGEMKKGIFSVMNYFLPLNDIGSFHCSANKGKDDDVALFFGLSGTGKTTLSTDPDRALIGDDEHGWDDQGVFNLEGGCYAKTIDLSKEKEPQIFQAIKRDALLENVVVKDDGEVDFHDNSKTENTRVSYPIFHIDNIVGPPSVGPHAQFVIFLTCDAFGVLPPVAKLNPEQAMYQYLSGYTAKVAGTEVGVTEPKATFSACFGAPFLSLHPTVYADILGKKMREHNAKAYLVSTGWTGGGYGVGHRVDLPATRTILNHIFDGGIEHVECQNMPVFGVQIPKSLQGVDPKILNPRDTWADQAAYDEKARKLGQMFVDNFKKFTDTERGRELEKAGPSLG